MNYNEFLHSKQRIPPACGFDRPKDMGMRHIGVELKESYFKLAVENCRKAEEQAATEKTEQPSLFDLMEGMA